MLMQMFWFNFEVCELVFVLFFFFKQKTAYEMRISDWSSDVCSSDLLARLGRGRDVGAPAGEGLVHGGHPVQDRLVVGEVLDALAVDLVGHAHLHLDRKSTRLNSSH